MCVFMCLWAHVCSQTQPSTAVETLGLQLMASRSWLRDFRWEITADCMCLMEKLQAESRMSPGTNNKSTWNIRKWQQVRIEGLDSGNTHFKSNMQYSPMLETTSSAAQRHSYRYSYWPVILDKLKWQVYLYRIFRPKVVHSSLQVQVFFGFSCKMLLLSESNVTRLYHVH